MSEAMDSEICPACGSRGAVSFFRSRLESAVASDWRIVQRRAEILSCRACAHLFKPGELVKSCADYANYQMLADRPERDKIEFNRAMPVSRSAALLAHLRARGILTGHEAALDYGCNRGAFLALLGAGSHHGFDVSEKYRPIVESLGHQYHTPEFPPAEDSVDVLTLIHVFEHLTDPARDMRPGLKALRPEGRVLLQVPDAMAQPTDLYVMDHVSHFSPHALDQAAGRVGLIPDGPQASPVSGEITGIYRSGSASPPSSSPTSPAMLAALKAALEEGERVIFEEKAASRPVVLYGAGLVGSLVAGALGPIASAYADDNPQLHGIPQNGRPVTTLESVPRGARVVLTVPPAAQARAGERARAMGLVPVTTFLPVFDAAIPHFRGTPK